MNRKTIAFLSMDDLGGFVSDDDLAIPYLQKLGWDVETVSWRSRTAEWERFSAVIIRSTWDYQQDLARFLIAVEAIDRVTRLANPLPIVRWNADKGYLRELETKGVKTVPTLWGDSISDSQVISKLFAQIGSDEIVIKPTVSASADSTFRLAPDSHLLPEVCLAFTNRAYMAQPFMQGIVQEGEYSLFYFNGDYSHTILKTPKPGDFRVQEEHGGLIVGVQPSDDLLAAGAQVMSNSPENLLYARVDLVTDGHGGYYLVELELIEPALFLGTDHAAPERFANAINRYLELDTKAN